MTKNRWISVPAGALGQGSADARPCGDLAVRAAAQPPFAARLGTGLPTARVRGFGDAPTGTPCTTRGDLIAQHDGTTLGLHTSSRPPS